MILSMGSKVLPVSIVVHRAGGPRRDLRPEAELVQGVLDVHLEGAVSGR